MENLSVWLNKRLSQDDPENVESALLVPHEHTPHFLLMRTSSTGASESDLMQLFPYRITFSFANIKRISESSKCFWRKVLLLPLGPCPKAKYMRSFLIPKLELCRCMDLCLNISEVDLVVQWFTGSVLKLLNNNYTLTSYLYICIYIYKYEMKLSTKIGFL